MAALALAAIVALAVTFVLSAAYPRRQALRSPRLEERGSDNEVQQLLADFGPAMPPHCGAHGALPQLWAPVGGPHARLKVLTFNLFWWSLYGIRGGAHGIASKLIARTGDDEPYDLMGFQECEDGRRVLREAGLLSEYTHFGGDGTRSSAVCMAFRTEKWILQSKGMEYVGVDAPSQYFGKRVAQWMRMKNRASGQTLFFVNHHGPLPVSSGGRCGGEAVAFNLLQLIATKAVKGDAIVVVGDFNAATGSATIRSLGHRLHPMFHGQVDGGIDWVFSNLDPSAVLSKTILDKAGSDHNPISVVLELGGAGAVPPPPPPLPSARPLPASTPAPTPESKGLEKPKEEETKGQLMPEVALCPAEYGVSYSFRDSADVNHGHGHLFVLAVKGLYLPEQCCSRCNLHGICSFWTWRQEGGHCVLWAGEPEGKEPHVGYVSGAAAPRKELTTFLK